MSEKPRVGGAHSSSSSSTGCVLFRYSFNDVTRKPELSFKLSRGEAEELETIPSVRGMISLPPRRSALTPALAYRKPDRTRTTHRAFHRCFSSFRRFSEDSVVVVETL